MPNVEGLIWDKDQWRKDAAFIKPTADLCENLLIEPCAVTGDEWDGMYTCYWPNAKKYLWKDGTWRQWAHCSDAAGTLINGGYFKEISDIAKVLADQKIYLEEIKDEGGIQNVPLERIIKEATKETRPQTG